MDCSFLVPCDLPGPSGGTHYNHEVVAALREAGHHVRVIGIPGHWPRPTSGDRRSLKVSLAEGPSIIVDGIIALAAPEEVGAATAGGVPIHVLVHSLLTADPDLADEERQNFSASECATLRAATSVIVVSQWSARDVAVRCPEVRPHVLTPGTSPARLAPGSDPPQLMVLAALTPVKNQVLVLRALSRLAELPWTLQLVGSDSTAPQYAEHLRRIVEEDFEPGRITFAGVLTGAALEDVWHATDLLVLMSTNETFGMVVTEALARGIPAVVSGGTGAVEALCGTPGCDQPDLLPGAVVDPGDIAALAATLTGWLMDPGSRMAWRAAAISRRHGLRAWARTAAELTEILLP